MNYIVCGKHAFLVNKTIQKILKDNLPEINDFSVVTFDYEDSHILPIIDDAMSLPLGLDKKAIIVKNPSFLFDAKYEDEGLEELPKLFNNQDPNITIIFSINYEDNEKKTFAKTSPIVKACLEKCQLIDVKDINKDEWPGVIKRLFDKYGIKADNKAVEEFVNRCGGNLNTVKNEIMKLSSYSSSITYDDINKLVNKPIEDNVFKILEALLNKTPDIAIKEIRNLEEQNKDLYFLPAFLAKQVRFTYQVGYLSSIGKKNKEIAEEMGQIPVWKVDKAYRQASRVKELDLLQLLVYFEDLDYKLKSGAIEPNLLIELLAVEPLRRMY